MKLMRILIGASAGLGVAAREQRTALLPANHDAHQRLSFGVELSETMTSGQLQELNPASDADFEAHGAPPSTRSGASLSDAALACRFYSAVCGRTVCGQGDMPAEQCTQENEEVGTKAWIDKEIDRLGQRVKNHPNLKHQFLALLEECSRHGFTAAQIDLITVNYFRACLEVIPSLLDQARWALERGDSTQFAQVCENLNDEAGAGNPKKNHQVLLLNSLNGVPRRLHGLSNLTIEGTYRSPLILPEITQFIENVTKLFRSAGSDHVVPGAGYADEAMSLPMITKYFEAYIEPYKDQFKPDEWAKIREYWDIHTGPMEAGHAQHYLDALKESCRTPKDVQEAHDGATLYLEWQARMLDAVHRAVFKAGNDGEVVRVLAPQQPPAKEDVTSPLVIHA